MISDAHEGLKAAIEQALTGAAWPRCTVHFMRNVLAQVARKDRKEVADALKLIFAQPKRDSAGVYLRYLAGLVQARFSKVAEMLLEAEEDILVYKTFPQEHHRSIHSTNPLERLNREVRRRTRVVGVFPDRPSVYRLVGTILLETDEDWRAGRRYFSQESMRTTPGEEVNEAQKDTGYLVDALINLEVLDNVNLHH